MGGDADDAGVGWCEAGDPVSDAAASGAVGASATLAGGPADGRNAGAWVLAGNVLDGMATRREVDTPTAAPTPTAVKAQTASTIRRRLDVWRWDNILITV